MSKPTITVHMIANAHLDPVWLWPWHAGLDEVLATCRTMCNLLDDYPDAIFTAGEAWRYYQISLVEPALLERIKKHVKTGQWALVNGWWIQPDCNFPSGFAMKKQIELGREFYLDTFGQFPEIAYNVDSFGHAAGLPAIIRAAGQRYYVMMRPGDHEATLPARLFRWRGHEGGPEVLTFRIAYSYSSTEHLPNEKVIRMATTGLPEGVTHTMCFYGVGDHGGGPSAAMLEWIRAHQNSFDGLRLEFSSPAKFFAAAAPQATLAPIVTGEVQYHAVGCYSVVRGIKSRVRKAEHLLQQTEQLPENGDPAFKARLRDAWRNVAFAHFHDILGGTSIASAYVQQYDQVGGACAFADDALHHALRRKITALPDAPYQRIVLHNASDSVYEGYTHFDPWLGSHIAPSPAQWKLTGKMLDENHNEVPFQVTQSETVNFDKGQPWVPRVLWRTRLEPGQMRVYHLDPAPAQAKAARVATRDNAIFNDAGIGVEFGTTDATPVLRWAHGLSLTGPQLQLIDDPTDNWSHSVDRYAEAVLAAPAWEPPTVIDSGPLMASLLRRGRLGDTTVTEDWRVHAEADYVELLLHVHLREKKKLLKLTQPLGDGGASRRDGVMGAVLTRPNSGRECPLRDWTMFSLSQFQFAVVSPDLYALDATPARARFTLLRSPMLTDHDPFEVRGQRATFSDQGEHLFRIRFYAAPMIAESMLERDVLMMHRPLIAAGLTRGMPRNSPQ